MFGMFGEVCRKTGQIMFPVQHTVKETGLKLSQVIQWFIMFKHANYVLEDTTGECNVPCITI